MVSVGNLVIGGKLDSTEIEAGLRRVQSGFRGLERDTKQAFGPFFNIEKSAKSLARLFVKIGTIGVTAMVGLASAAPAVSPALAKMAIGLREISFELGRQFKPLFESVANDLLPALSQALTLHGDKITSFVGLATGAVGDISNLISGNLEGIKNKIPKAAVLGAAIGFKLFGAKGLFIGAALGMAAGLGAEISETDPKEARMKLDSGEFLNLKEFTVFGAVRLRELLIDPFEELVFSFFTQLGEAIKNRYKKGNAYADHNGVSS